MSAVHGAPASRCRTAAWVAALAAALAACASEGGASEGSETGPPDFEPPEPECGNGFVEEGEQCDDANTEDGDGCDRQCQIPCGLVWEASVPTTETEVAPQVRALALSPSGEIVVFGTLDSTVSEFDDDLWLASFSASGEPLWSEVVDVDEEDDELAGGVAVASDGSIYLSATLNPGDSSELWVARFDALGQPLWSTIVPELVPGGRDEASGMAVDGDDRPVVSGSLRVGDGDSDLWVARLSPEDGSEQWSATWSGEAAATGFSLDLGGPVAIAPNGLIWVLAHAYVDFETRDVHLLSFDPGSEPGAEPLGEWAPQAGDTGRDHLPVGLSIQPDGAVNVGIARAGAAANFWLHRLEPSAAGDSGELSWVRERDSFVDAGSDWTLGGLAAANGELFVGGGLDRESAGDSWIEAWAQRLDDAGETSCAYRYTALSSSPVVPNLRVAAVGAVEDQLIAAGTLVEAEDQRFWVGAFRGP